MSKVGVFIINQDINLSDVAKASIYNKLAKVVIVSTHYLFFYERNLLSSLLKNTQIEIMCFSDLLNDEELEACDNKTTKELSNSQEKKKYFTEKYRSLFVNRSMFLKNKLIYEKLISKASPDIFFYGNGLGISSKFWSTVLNSSFLGDKYRKNIIVTILGKINARIKQKISNYKKKYLINVFETETVLYFFCGSINRLNYNSKYLIYSAEMRTKEFGEFINKQKRESTKEVRYASTVHNYPPCLFFSETKDPIYIFTDGYFPSNYTRSYIEVYNSSIIVPSDIINAIWFKNHSFDCIDRPEFINIEAFKKNVQEKEDRIKYIVLILGHAGDWSSLINRSDTDILVSVYCESLAKYFPDINFIVRPHPTMVHSDHEGLNSLKRIIEYVNKVGQPNVQISSLTLEEDLSRGDLFILEYSNVFFDIWKRNGKFAIIANLTNRRSFMKYFEDLGFPSASTSEDLVTLIRQIIDEHMKFIDKTNKAVESYNKTLNL